VNLLKQGANPNAQYTTTWLDVDTPKEITVPILTVSLGWFPPFSGCFESIMMAARRKTMVNTEIVRALCDGGATIGGAEDEDQDPILYAIRHCNLEVVKLLWSRKSKLSFSQARYLIEAAKAVCPDTVNFLVENIKDVNQRNEQGQTALIAIASIGPMFEGDRGNQVMIEENLLQHGAQVNLQDKDGMTALMWAASYQNETSVRLLLRYNPALDLHDNGSRVLHISGGIVRLVAPTLGGRTALDWAHGEPTIERLLKMAAIRRHPQD